MVEGSQSGSAQKFRREQLVRELGKRRNGWLRGASGPAQKIGRFLLKSFWLRGARVALLKSFWLRGARVALLKSFWLRVKIQLFRGGEKRGLSDEKKSFHNKRRNGW
jgi:hypothetical protein